MATTAADRIVLDTNVLLTATDERRPWHQQAREALDVWPAEGRTVYTTGQILREYLAVATRPQDVNGLGLARSDANDNVRAFLTRLRFLTEDERTTQRLLALLDEVACSGKQVHDANIVAVMMASGVASIATLNVTHFTRFAPAVKVIDLST